MISLDFRATSSALSLALLCAATFTTSCSSAGDGETGGTQAATSSGHGGQSASSVTGSTGTGQPPCGFEGGLCCSGSCDEPEVVCIGGLCKLPLLFGGACTSNDDCDSKLCLQSGVCSKPCANAADCPPAPEWTCGPLPNYPDTMCQCAPSGPEACDGQDNDCNGVIDDKATCVEAGFTCQSGACACDPMNLCNGVCKDLASDDQNCGACGASCTMGAVCSAGYCLTTLASGQTPVSIAVDATSVYWTNNPGKPGGTVMKLPLGGGAPVTLASGQTNANNIALDASHVYWTTDGMPSTLMKVPVGGGAPTTLASGITSPWGIAVNATDIYWANSANPDGAVMKMPLGGGAPMILAAGQPSAWGVALDATSVYWASFGGAVGKAPLGGGAITELARAERKSAREAAIAVDATSIYWTTNEAIMTMPKGGGVPVALASGQSNPGGIALDATSVYWTGGVAGDSVMKVAKSGGAPTTLALGQSGPFAIAVDATSVYWTTLDSVMKAQK